MLHEFLVKLDKVAKIVANSIGSSLQHINIKFLVLSEGPQENAFFIVNKHHLSALILNDSKS